jgi:thaumarchaeosortase
MTNQAGTSVRLSISMLKESWLHVSLIACFAAAIALLMFLDYFNLEKIAFFNNTGFMFDYTWKGRLFLLFFFWLFVLESFTGLKSLNGERGIKSRSKLRLIAVFLVALIPLIYVIGINFLGLDQIVIRVGELIRLDYWKANSIFWSNFVNGDWPLSLEYVVFTIAFVATVLLAYGKKGLRTFSISAALVAGIAVVYMIDTMYPGGAFTPFQVFALPTSACAAAVLQAIGMRFSLVFSPILASTPVIATYVNGSMVPTSIAWPCAGVQSLFLYTILILLLFKKSDISLFRKSVYFIIGAVGTYSVNVLRIVTYFVLLVNQGTDAALTFHNVYGELYFFAWILLYMLLIITIQKYNLVEKTKIAFTKIVTRRNSP